MKREYRKPTIEVVDIETTETCLKAVSWNVDGGKNPDDHGYIIEDQGKDHYNGHEKDDPWNSDNW